MEELKLENLIEKIPNKDCCIIVIENDLTEAIYKIEENRNDLKSIIKEKTGFCFKFKSDKYFFWEYNSTRQIYDYWEKEGRDDFYLHDKLRADLNISKISGEKYREEK